ncbi:MAG: metal ABC transporter solute-binding protein, Zn/Mn family, partial [Candidatus Dormibacteria bacterium]
VAAMAQQHRGMKIAATEDIVVYLAQALHLDVISPPQFMQAVAEGNEPPAGATALFHQQIASREATVLVYNTQTVTAVTTNIQDEAGSAGIPVVGVSETLQPPTATFQGWQLSQLRSLQQALQHANRG